MFTKSLTITSGQTWFDVPKKCKLRGVLQSLMPDSGLADGSYIVGYTGLTSRSDAAFSSGVDNLLSVLQWYVNTLTAVGVAAAGQSIFVPLNIELDSLNRIFLTSQESGALGFHMAIFYFE